VASPWRDLTGKLDALSLNQMCTCRALCSSRILKDQLQGLLHTLSGLFDVIAADLHIACSYAENERASARLLLQRLLER